MKKKKIDIENKRPALLIETLKPNWTVPNQKIELTPSQIWNPFELIEILQVTL